MARMTKDVRRDYVKPDKYLTIEEVQRLLRFVKIEADRARRRGSIRGLVNEMIILLMLETGIRSEELCHLILSDLPTHHGKDAILVRKKRGQSARVVSVDPDLRKKLETYIKKCRPGAKPGSPLFASEQGHRLLRTRIKKNKKWVITKEHTSRITYRSLYRRIKRIARDAKIPHLKPHAIRHTLGCHLYSVERDIAVVAKVLGHKSVSSTQIYVGVIDDSVRRQMVKTKQLFSVKG